MRLISVDVVGFKRFADANTLKVDGPLVAIVGPNEAGKTSLLEAMAHLDWDVRFARTEYAGRVEPDSPNKTIVSARFRVEPKDHEALGDLLDPSERYILTQFKRVRDSSFVWNLRPRIPRDVSERNELADALQMKVNVKAFVVPAEEEAGEDDTETQEIAGAALAELRAADEDLTEVQLRQLDELVARLEGFEDAGLTDVRERLSRVIPLEREDNPTNRAGRALIKRTPKFLLFDALNRQLDAEYAWADYPEAPPALDNLCILAGIDFASYREVAMDRGRRDELHTLQKAANTRLEQEFASWTQAGIAVAFHADNESLQLHVFDEGDDRAIPFDQRSSGLRAFVALIAFAVRYGEGTRPVLLIDEAETHLHYGGQADLMQVFERQRLAQTIIYTTHSIGCLPEDLGTTIRAVTRLANERSEIRNSFWASGHGGAGLTPLMLAMGAGALAFTPARFALIGEGPTEAILLPSLFRDARAERFHGRPLGFQVAPGIARVSTAAAADLELDAGNVAYLIDADDGGRTHADKLADRVDSEGRLLILGDDQEEGLCLEDFIEIELYAEAINATLPGESPELEINDLSNVARPASVEAWCKTHGLDAPLKTEVAVQALNIAREQERSLVDPTRADHLSELYERIRGLLNIPDDA